jgi:NAD(P)-dependent dehydrogenase (short-subunit alcohol dehydrogenase family)
MLASAGARVVVADRDAGACESCAAEITGQGGLAVGLCADVADEDAVVSLFGSTLSYFGCLDILVNNAGIAIRKPATELALEDWNRVVAVNMTGIFRARTAARHMIAGGQGGAIVNTASIMGLSGGGLYPNISYQATKGAVVNMTRAFAVEWAAHNTRVNAVAPTYVRTALIAPILAEPELLEKIKATTPLKPIEMRVKAAEGLLGSKDPNTNALGVKALEALMKTSHFTSHYEFDFGARSRDYGYYPRTGEEVHGWFDAVLKLASTFALSDSPVTGGARKSIAREFRGLWSNSGRAEDLDRLAREIATKSFWRDGWIAARQTRTYDGKGMQPELRERLTALEEFLRPKDLISKVRGLVIGARGGSLDLDDFDDEEDDEQEANGKSKGNVDYAVRAARSAAVVRELGHDVAADEDAFKVLLPELMGGDGRVSVFGKALAEVAEKPRAMWDAVVAQFAATEHAGLHLLGGLLSGLQTRGAAVANTILDEALEDQVLAAWFPILQANGTIDDRALARLHRALDLGKAPINTFYSLAYGRTCDQIAGPQFRSLVLAIARKPGGCAVGLEMISMRLHSDHSAKREPLPEVREAGRLVLEEFEFHSKDGRTTREDHELGIVIRASLAGPEGVSPAHALCRKFMAAAARHDISAYDFDDLMKGLLQVHPIPILDELFSGDVKSLEESVRLLHDLLRFHHPVLDVVPDEVLLTWCDRGPALRYPLAAAVATLFKRPKDGEPHEWTPLVRTLFEKAPDPLPVLNEIVQRLYPSSWSGSKATKLEGRLKLLNSLPGGDAPALAAAMAEARSDLQASIDTERKREKDEDRARSNRFE